MDTHYITLLHASGGWMARDSRMVVKVSVVKLILVYLKII